MGLFDFLKPPAPKRPKAPYFWFEGGRTMSVHEFGFMATRDGLAHARTFFDEVIASGRFGEQLTFIPRLLAKRGLAELMLAAYCSASVLYSVSKVVNPGDMKVIMDGVADGVRTITLQSGEKLPSQIQEHLFQEIVNLTVAIDEGHTKVTRASTKHLMKVILGGYATSEAELADWEQWMSISVEGYELVNALDELRVQVQRDCQASFVPVDGPAA